MFLPFVSKNAAAAAVKPSTSRIVRNEIYMLIACQQYTINLDCICVTKEHDTHQIFAAASVFVVVVTDERFIVIDAKW
jgi:hypothetical protein